MIVLRFRCVHCLADLGPVVEGEPQPECPDHPAGQVDIVEDRPDGDS